MLRRAIALGTVVLSVAAGLVVAAAPASAAGACGFSLTGIPANYRIGVDVATVRAGGSCAGANNWGLKTAVFRDWGTHQYVSGSTTVLTGCTATLTDSLSGDCLDVDTFRTYPKISSARLDLVTPGNLFTGATAQYAEQSANDFYSSSFAGQKFMAKYATRTGLTTSRTTGNRVTLTITPSYYSVSRRTFVPATSTYIQVQRLVNNTWVRVVSVRSTTPSITYSFYNATRYQYRAYLPATNTTWSYVSPVRVG